ncbi:hypothetical protein FKR81_29340 [Lentzea tibetensis]|uniref:Uncharacterized protein n=1 Tax=Lentzea tibetensis TaxID=2591470 RepID=A0A563EMB9_9PSEU|nr:hypothetical protein [Lentzea tibetensis]TWP48088.1 hypothetical protein FKR81_29340 [Lentzea tibetensis]
MRPVREVVEYDDIPLEPSDHDLELLTHPDLRGYFSLRRTRKGWTLKVRSAAGVLVLDCAELRISPKIPISGEMLLHWLHWLHYATKPYNTTVDQPRRWDVEGTYFTDLVVQAFLDECRILLRNQLRKDYVREEDVQNVLRGRLDVVKQASQRYGMLDRLHVRTFDRRVEVWENEVCGAALRYAARHAEQPRLRCSPGSSRAATPRPRAPRCDGSGTTG